MKKFKGLKILMYGKVYSNKKKFAYFPILVHNLNDLAYYLIWLRPYMEDRKKQFMSVYRFINE